MKVVALVSGGKDSCFNMLECVRLGHDIVALANLHPPQESVSDEMDSFTFQTVGHDVLQHYADAMQVPMFRGEIHGTAVNQELEYTLTENDETEDLYRLLAQIKEAIPDIQAVSVGAILSNYQRTRVEHVCKRLNLVTFAFLWERDQNELYDEMVKEEIGAIFIKVAAMGLLPKHLGKTLAEMRREMLKLGDLYELNMCGEGGEYETLTLDCPLFHRSIHIDESTVENHSDDAFAPVAFLKVQKASLQDKLDFTPPSGRPITYKDARFMRGESLEILDHLEALSLPSTHVNTPDVIPAAVLSPSSTQSGTRVYIANVVSGAEDGSLPIDLTAEAHACFASLKATLGAYALTLEDIVFMGVYVKDMADFAKINAVYAQYFVNQPPARLCVQLPLPHPHRMLIECTADAAPKSTLHIESFSFWAPPMIGPYSQKVQVDDTMYIAGQIAMLPWDSSMPAINDRPEAARAQVAISYQHVQSIARTHPAYTSGTPYHYTICYVTCPEALFFAQALWKELGLLSEALFVTVPGLPKGALVEWQCALPVVPSSLKWEGAFFRITAATTIAEGQVHGWRLYDQITIQAQVSGSGNISLLLAKVKDSMAGMIYGQEQVKSGPLLRILFTSAVLDVTVQAVLSSLGTEIASLKPAVSLLPVLDIGGGEYSMAILLSLATSHEASSDDE